MLKGIGTVLGPALFALGALWQPESLSDPQWFVVRTATWMLAWWLTEALPIAATALLPIILFPLGNVLGIREVCEAYGHYLVFLFLGGFLLALGIEKWNLHKRIALHIIRATGDSANRMILGFMLASAFLSMWISNTATTVMMLPIATSVIGVVLADRNEIDARRQRLFALTLMLGVAYAANIGGIATLIGTPPNIAMKGAIEETYDVTISFSHWMVLGVPFSALMLILTYLVLTRLVYRNRIGRFEGARAVIKHELQKLGRIGKGERGVLVVFILTASLWIARGGINSLLESWNQGVKLSDTAIAIAGGLLLFLVPGEEKGKPLLEWEDTRRLPWGILLLFGGGLALAAAFKSTGLIEVVAQGFNALANLDTIWIILILTTTALFLTELMSNLALVQVFVPVVASVAVGMGYQPLLFAVPVTLAASCAFMFPMSTPPNAIVFASGHVRIPDMAKAGIWLNLLAIALIAIFAAQFLEWWLPEMQSFP